MRAPVNELVELVFEGLDESTALHLAGAIIGDSAHAPVEEAGVWEIEMPRLELGKELALRNAHVRVLRYDGVNFDVEVNFALADVSEEQHARIAVALQAFAQQKALESGVSKFFAGLEPAVDADTRIFTGASLGPYSLG